MKKFASFCLLLSFISTLPVYSLAQTQTKTQTDPKKSTPAPPQDEVVRINVNLVQIDVTVLDDKGRPVTDLKPEDFEILEEGKPQKLTNFSFVTQNQNLPAPAAVPTPPPIVTNASGKNRNVFVPPPIPPVRLRPEAVRRTIALVVDDLGLSHESSARVRLALAKFVDQEVQPGDLVAIIRTGAGMGALQQFTTDKRLLHAAIERVRYNLGSRSDISTFAPIGGNGVAVQINDDSLAIRSGIGQDQTRDSRGPASFRREPGEQNDQFREELFSVGTLGALNFIVRGLKDLPGRKSVVLFSDGFKLYSEDPGNTRVLENLRRLTDLANRASVVFYTIDPRGLQFTGMSAADNLNGPMAIFNPIDPTPVKLENMSPEQIAAYGGEEGAAAFAKRSQLKHVDEFYGHTDSIEQAITDRGRNFFETQQGLSFLAKQTGGFAVKNNNDMNGALRRVLADQAGFYLLGYRPDDASFKAGANRPFHNISVNVKRPGLHVRTRNGFYGFSEQEASRPVRKTAAEQLFAALTSPFGAGDIELRMTALFGYDQERGPFTQSLLHINTRNLTFHARPEGGQEAIIDIMAVTFGDNGKVVDHDDRAYKIQISDKDFATLQSAGLVYIVTLPIKKPGAYQLRIAVRDHATQKVGAANQFIEVPDVKKNRLTLSGITLRGVAAQTNQAPAPTAGPTNELLGANDPQTGPAGRRLRSGMILNYAYYIYAAQLDKTTQLPKLSTQIRLFRDGLMIFAGRFGDYQGQMKPGDKEHVAGGSLQLANNLSPGEYVLQVIVVDHLAKSGQQVAAQWIDFDIADK